MAEIYNLSTELEIDPNFSLKSLSSSLDDLEHNPDSTQSTSLPYTKSIPTLLLYDNKGLQLYDEITQGEFRVSCLQSHATHTLRNLLLSVLERVGDSERQ